MKRFISLLLAFVLAASLVTVPISAVSIYPDGMTSEEAVAQYEIENGVTVPTYRYYFQMPNGRTGPVATDDVVYYQENYETGEKTEVVYCAAGEKAPSWYNEYTEGAGIYWWSGAAPCDRWAGYQAMSEDYEQSIYYADVPRNVVSYIWNNGVDGGMDSSNPIYYCAAQTVDIASEYPDPGEYASIPEGADSFDNMIVIVDPDKIDVNPLSKKATCGYNWYFYYGDGCYGSYAMDSAEFVSVEDNCLNPDHYVNGVHVGYQHEAPIEEEEAVIWFDGEEYLAHVGDTVEFTSYLDLSMCENSDLCSLDYRIYYDKSKLRLISEWSKDDYSEIYPNFVGGSPSVFNNNEDYLLCLASSSSGYDYSERKELVTLKFEVIDSGESEIVDYLNILADYYLNRLVYNGEVYADFDLTSGICVDCPHGYEPIEPTIPSYDPTEPADDPTEPVSEEAVIWYDGDSYYAHVGDTVEFRAYLDLSMCDVTSADSLDYRIDYDMSKLRLISDWKAVDGSSEAFPCCNDHTNLNCINNTDQNRTYLFATATRPWELSESKLFINLQFEVIDTGEFEMSDYIRTLSCTESGYRFVDEGEAVAGFDFSSGIWVDCPHVYQPETSEVTLHVKHADGADWTPYLWLWTTDEDGGVQNVFDSWPGEDMGEPCDDWYSIQVTWGYIEGMDQYNFVLSDNGSPQTIDYGPYSLWDESELWIVIDDDMDCDIYTYNPDGEPELYYYYMIGSFTDWDLDYDYCLEADWSDGETTAYFLNGITLRVSDSFNVVKVNRYGEILEWCLSSNVWADVNGIYNFEFYEYPASYGYGLDLVQYLSQTTPDEAEGAEEIFVGDIKTAEIGYGQKKYYIFTPEEDMTVTFYSMASADTYGYLYNSDLYEIARDDDSGKGTNFSLTYAVKGGQTYYFGAWYYNSDNTGSYDVALIEGAVAYEDPVFEIPEDAAEIAAGDVVNVAIDEPNEIAYYVIKPDESNYYYIRSTSGTDPMLWILEEDGEVFASADDNYNGNNSRDFYLEVMLDAGKSYYLAAKLYYPNMTGSFDLAVKADPTVRNLESIEFEAIRPLYAGLNESPLTAMQATFCFDNSDPLTLDLGYRTNYSEGHSYNVLEYFYEYIEDKFSYNYDVEGDTNEVGEATVTFYGPGVTCDFNKTVDIEIVENPVASIEAIGSGWVWAPNYQIEEDKIDIGDEPDYEPDYEAYRTYYNYDPEDLLITYADGSTVYLSDIYDWNGTYSRYYNAGITTIVLYGSPDDTSPGSNLKRNGVIFSTDQREEPWTAGGTYTAGVSYMGRYTEYPVTVDEYKPIKVGDDTSVRVNFTEPSKLVFVPQKDMPIELSISGYSSARAEMYDAQGSLIAETDVNNSGYGSIRYEVIGGETYYFSLCYTDGDEFGSYIGAKLIGFSTDDIYVGDSKTAVIEECGGKAYFRFVPEEDMTIYYWSESESDPVGEFYDEDMNCLAVSDDYFGRDFFISYFVEAGKTYYLGARFYGNSNIGSYTVYLSNANPATPDEPSTPDEPTVVYYYMAGSFSGWDTNPDYQMFLEDSDPDEDYYYYRLGNVGLRAGDTFNFVAADQYGNILDWVFYENEEVSEDGYYNVSLTRSDGVYCFNLDYVGDIEPKTITVYFTNIMDWNSPRVYYWFDTYSDIDWPGISMDFDNYNIYGQPVFYVEIPADVDGIIFNGIDADGILRQTVDITDDIWDDQGWYPTGLNDAGRFSVEQWSVEEPDEPVDSYRYIGIDNDLYKVVPGNTYTYEFRLNINDMLTSVDVDLRYDNNDLELVDYEFFGIDSDAACNVTDDGCFLFNYANAEGALFDEDDDILVRVYFKVKEDAPEGIYGIYGYISDMTGSDEYKLVESYDYYDEFYQYQLITDAEYIAPVICGDVDGDGVVTILDATRIQRYLVELCNLDGNDYDLDVDNDSVYESADVTGDGNISILDALRIRRYLVGLCDLDGSVYEG